MICLPLRGAQLNLPGINRWRRGFERFSGFYGARIGCSFSRSPKKSSAIKMVQHMTTIAVAGESQKMRKPVAAWHYLWANRHDNEEQINRIKYNYEICSSVVGGIFPGAGVA